MIRHLSYLACLASCLLSIPAFPHEEEATEEFFLSSPEQIAALSSEPSYLIGGLISPLSGHPILRQTDLIVNGAQSITLFRTYIPPHIPCSFPQYKYTQKEWDKYHLYQHVAHNYKGWQFFPHLKLLFTPRSMTVLLTEPNGVALEFCLSGPNFSITTLTSPSYALSNAAGDAPHGNYDPRNTRISYEENKITVYATDGTTRCYYKKRQETRITQIYLLEKEILPNGKVLKYRYNDKERLNYVESLDPQERFVYASIRIDGSPWESHCHFTSSSGTAVDYSYQRKPLHIKVKDKHKYRHHNFEGKYKFICPPTLSSVSSPFDRHETLDYCDNFLLRSYSGRDSIFTTFNTGFGEDVQHFKTHQLLLPVGKNDAFEPVYTLNYQPPVAGVKKGTTTVENSDGTSIVYHFSKNLLPTLIQYFGQDKRLKKEKSFSWDDKNWLKSIEMRDREKNIFYKKSYEFDKFGNPISESFTGDLTGEGNQETFTTKKTFSEEGRNLLLREESENGKVICFSYLPHTNLVISKLTKDRDKIILRTFFIYDDCNNLIQEISDDGISEDSHNLSQVTQRILTTYVLRPSAPFLHMPEWIEKTYWEEGVEKKLKKSHLIYDGQGNIAEERVYDANGQHAYTLLKTYNERGDLLSETNSLGQRATYTYDSKGRPETSTNFSNRLRKTFHHDIKGRLRELTEKGDDGIVHITSSEYDFYDRQILKKDPFQNSTLYTYDPLVSKITKTDFPPIASIDGSAVAITTFSNYDPFGRELAKTDPNGNTTIYKYNAYGAPSEIFHPNGGKEHFRYAKNGKLIRHTDPDGLTIDYKNDILDRVLSKIYVSADGTPLAEETFIYKGFNLLTETDKEGNLKHYSYDGAGRKIREDFCGHVTDFAYDSLGWLSTTCKHNGDNTLLIHYTRDLEGQILEEHKTDLSSNTLHKISFSYDADGNQKTITRYINGKEAIETFFYDSFCRRIQHTDAMGYISKTLYNEHYINPLNQRVLQTTFIDPRHILTIEIHDALARLAQTKILNPQRALISCQNTTHDPQGNLLYQQDHVYENTHFKTIQTIQYTYTPNHKIESITRAFGTKDARATTYTYLPSGKRSTKTSPDGIILFYTYHPLGFISHLDSSDDKIHHVFECDKLGHLRYAFNESQNIAIKRTIDPFGNVTQEIFPHGLEVRKDYDAFNRPISLKMASQGEILYTYDPLFLRQVIRLSNQGEPLYTHTYESYDDEGNLVAETLIGNLGLTDHTTDLRKQKTSISNPYFSQKCTYDPAGNLISTITDTVEHHYTYDGLSQLSSETTPNQSTAYTYDSLYNRTQKSEKTHKVNSLNELSCFPYDLNGNQLLNTPLLTYDSLNQLTDITFPEKKISFAYDPLGRRSSKIVYAPTPCAWKPLSHEYYLYDDQNEIGAFSSPNEPKNLRVLGLPSTTISIEVENQIFAPLLDVQGNIRRLIDLKKTITTSYNFTPFGESLQTNPQDPNPWGFASKRLDPELGLIYFGKRYYDPKTARWLTPDPAGLIDSANPYQYVFNNPFRYSDPDGQFIFAIPLLALTWKVVAIAAVTAYVSYELEHQHRHSNSEFSRNFNSAVHEMVQHVGGVSQYLLNQSLDIGKKKQLDERLPNNPDELLNDSNWEETSHPKAKEKGHRSFENKSTGEKLRYDEGKAGAPGHKGESHWHRSNPNATNRFDEYLDANDNPVPEHSDPSHLYPL